MTAGTYIALDGGNAEDVIIVFKNYLQSTLSSKHKQ